MPKKLPPYVDRFRDRHGKVRLYFRRNKKTQRIPLPGSIGSAEFLEGYHRALGGQIQLQASKGLADDNTIGSLVGAYLRSNDYRRLRPTSKAGYFSRLEAIRVQHGFRSVAGMTREKIEAAFLTPYADRPGAALDTLKKLRILIRFGIATGRLAQDHSIGIKRPKTQEIRSWTDVEIANFEARWPVGTKQRLGFALSLFTGQRRSDVHRMTWTNVTDTTIQVVQQKTGRKLTIPLASELRAVLEVASRDHVTIINTAFGRPFSVDGFSRWMRDAIAAAGLPLECQPHGLRKAAGRRLAEAGCTANEIMSVLGHKTLAEAERYTRDADQGRLAEAAVLKLEGRNRNKISQTTSAGFGNAAKRGETSK